MTFRWTYAEGPTELPTLVVTKVALTEVRSHLPPGTREMSAAEQRERIRVRPAHGQRRYPQY